MSYLLGIDVGTTRTAAAICRPGGRATESEMVVLGDRSSAVPSVLHVADDGAILVGEAAERRAVSDPDRVVREFKRRIGDPTPIVVGGRPWAPEELSARLVRWVVERVAQREGGPATRIALTHPASWGAHKKDRFGGALAGQGIPVTFLAEPQAAALQYAAGERVEPGSTIAVYDLGGGTFDAALVHKDAQGFSLLGRPEGLERLGGVDFDEAVFEYVRSSLPDAFADLDDTDPAVLSAIAAVRRECTEAKEALSSDTEVSISVLTPAGQGAVRLHRSEFEALIRPQVDETVDALRRAIQSAGLSAPQLTAVLLVGGSSRVPLVAQLVSEQLGRPVAVDTDPKNAIALGAALSLTPAGAAGGGNDRAAARVPSPRPAPGRPGGRDIYDGTTGVVVTGGPARAGAAPIEGQTQVRGAAARGFGPAGAAAATAYPGPPAQRGAGDGSMATRAAGPPVRPLPYPDRPMSPDDVDYEYEHPEPASGRTPAMLVSIGGAAAAVAVIASVFLFHGKDPVSADEGRFAAAQSGPATSTTTSATPTASDDPVIVTDKPSRPSRPPVVQAPRTTAPAPTTVPLTTVPPAPTTEPPAPTSKLPTPPTKELPAPTTDPLPPVDDGAALN